MTPLLSVDDALGAITETLSPLEAEPASIHDSVIGRVLAENLFAELSHPPQDVSAMDGYAVRYADLAGGALTVIGESAAGHPFQQSLQKGEAARIFTGAYCPEGGDTIIIQENAELKGQTLTVLETAPQGKYIRPKGHDFQQGDCIAQAGDAVSARALALMASAGIQSFSLYPRPLVAIISTGDELVMPGEIVGEGQIISSNGLFLKNYFTLMGAETLDLGIVGDDDHALQAAFEKATSADLIITSGGASVGQHDGVAQAMTGHPDTALHFWRIAMRPGKPLIFGKIHDVPMLGLPGNPVSTGVCAMIFGAVALKALTGQDISQDWGLDLRWGRLAQPLQANDGRQEYLRSRLHYDADGMAILSPFSQQDSGMMQIFAKADALAIRPPFAEASETGDLIRFLPIPKNI